MIDVTWLRWWADLLDSRFRVPGTRIRFGLDPLLSLVPGLGDLTSPIFTLLVLLQARRLRVPHIVMARMVLNALIDALIGVVPIAGNIGDVFFRANLLNLALLERHAQPGRPASTSDYVFVWGLVALLVLVVVVPVVIGIWLTLWLWHWLVH